MSYSGNERRRFLRVPFQSSIRYRLCYERFANEIIEASAHNLSQNGILFKTKYPPPQSAIIALNIELDKLKRYLDREGLTDIIDVDQVFVRGNSVFGEVIRVIEEQHSGFFSVAVNIILKKDPQAEERIERAKVEEHPQYIDPTVVPDEEKYDIKKKKEEKKSHPQYIDPDLADEE